MQTLSGQGSVNNLNSQSRAIAVISIILFALAGLLSGFAVGAFIRPAQQQLANNTNTALTPPPQRQVHTPTTNTPALHSFPMNPPAIQQFQYSEIANGSTIYSFTAQAIDKQNQPVHGQSLTCKLWLTADGDVNANIPISRLRSVDTLAQPFPAEVQGALNFTTGTPQTQPCNSNGQGQWSYTVSPSLEHGTHYLVVLIDWNGVHFNWSWVATFIKKGD